MQELQRKHFIGDLYNHSGNLNEEFRCIRSNIICRVSVGEVRQTAQYSIAHGRGEGVQRGRGSRDSRRSDSQALRFRVVLPEQRPRGANRIRFDR